MTPELQTQPLPSLAAATSPTTAELTVQYGDSVHKQQ